MDQGHSSPEYRTTRDLALAAYMMMRGLQIKKAERRNGGGRASFSFTIHDPEGQFDQLAVDFANSESQRFDSCVRTVKKLMNRNGKP